MSYRTRQRRLRRQQNRTKPIILTLSIIGLLFLIGIVMVVAWVLQVAATAPPLSSLKQIDKGTSSVVYAADGTRLGYITSDIVRTPITWSSMPKTIREATVAVEDRRFYSHNGVDYESVIRAGLKDLEAGKSVEGASTITQQLVRNLYTNQHEHTLERKIKEAKLAQELERKHSKQWILTAYLNSAPYGTVNGQNAVGIQAAAETFFAKPAKNLTTSEAALLAGLPQAPSAFNPFKNHAGAFARRNAVLKDMVETDYLSNSQAQKIIHKRLGVKHGNLYTKVKEPFFFDYVKQQLIDKYGAAAVRTGGMKIQTTIYPDLQQSGRDAIDSTLDYRGDPSAAVLSLDPKNGYIRVMASSGRYQHNQYNLAAQAQRQPGSVFKTFVLTTAIARGINPYTTYYLSHPLDIFSPAFGEWKVNTYSQTYGGIISIYDATLQSDNTVFAQLDLDVGPKAVASTAKRMGIKAELKGYPAEGLGGLKYGVSPLEIATAYATLASGGVRNDPVAITKVKFPDGHFDILAKPKHKRVLSDAVADVVTRILQQNMVSGTGVAANIGCPAAGKTGTTDNFSDAWFSGYTPNLATAVWVGYPDSLRPMRYVHGISVAGGTFPAQIWNKFMQVARNDKCNDFLTPTNSVSYSPFQGTYTRSLPTSYKKKKRGKK